MAKKEKTREELISEKEQIEKSLRIVESKYQALINQIPAVTYTVELGDINKTVYISPQIKKIFGYSPEEWLADPELWIKRLHPEDKERILAEVYEKNLSGDSFYLKYRIIHKDGNIVWINNQSTYLKDENGKIYLVHGIMLDVSIHQKAIEEAEKANRAKNDFMARMSHEVRTPLNAILGFSEILKESGLQDIQLDYMNMLSSNGLRLLELVNDIFDYSKLETKKIILNNEPFCLDCIIEKNIDIVKPLLKNKNVKIFSTISKKNIFVNGDKPRMNQILSNLLLNSVKFTETGEIAVELNIESENEKIINVKIDVRDTGIGIPENFKNKIFQPFDQADGTLTRKFGGAGIGLTITKKLVELMNGNILFRSEKGKGSVFTLKIPFEKNLVSKNENNIPAAEKKRPSKTFFNLKNNFKILVVEDNPTNQKLVKIILQKEGYLVDIADNGLVCIEKLEKEKYDFIFMDMEMPVMDGVTATVELRKKYSDIPVVALTANVFEEARERCFKAGMNDFLTKPFNRDTIISTVEKWILKK